MKNGLRKHRLAPYEARRGNYLEKYGDIVYVKLVEHGYYRGWHQMYKNADGTGYMGVFILDEDTGDFMDGILP